MLGAYLHIDRIILPPPSMYGFYLYVSSFTLSYASMTRCCFTVPKLFRATILGIVLYMDKNSVTSLSMYISRPLYELQSLDLALTSICTKTFHNHHRCDSQALLGAIWCFLRILIVHDMIEWNNRSSELPKKTVKIKKSVKMILWNY